MFQNPKTPQAPPLPGTPLPITAAQVKPKTGQQPIDNMGMSDIRDAWLRALVEYSEWLDGFVQQVVGNDSNVAIGMLFHQALQQPGLADQWKSYDPEGYNRAAKAAGFTSAQTGG